MNNDIVIRLLELMAELLYNPDCGGERQRRAWHRIGVEAIVEIERLRAAGDALHAWITVNATSIQQERLSHDKVLSDWEEARRG